MERERSIPISTEAFERFRDVLELTVAQTYPEVPSGLHQGVTALMLDRIITACAVPRNGRILDVGCGQGPALDLLRDRGYRAVGITINAEDLRVCRDHGHEVYAMDQSFLEFPNGEFDLVWARHCVEHSVMPFITLLGFHRVLKDGAFLYLEVPSPDTACHHERNCNHYSTLTKSAWLALLDRCGFRVMWENDFVFQPEAGEDTYFMFVCRRDAARGV